MGMVGGFQETFVDAEICIPFTFYASGNEFF